MLPKNLTMMSAMTVRAFADTNIIIYSESKNQGKSELAAEIIKNSPVISTQVINESVNVLTRKYGFLLLEAHEIALSLMEVCEVVAIDVSTLKKAIELCKDYSLSHWDSLIIAAALKADCTILYSEDMQHNQIIENRLTIINPFL